MLVAKAAVPALEAEPEQVGLSAARLANLTRVIQWHVDRRTIPGAITMVARRGKLIHLEKYGHMDVEAGKPMGLDTIFRMYSMTKPVVSVGLMALYEEGRFQLDDPAAKYIPDFNDLRVFAGGTADSYETREPARPITMRDLLMHTSGLANATMAGGPSTPVSELYSRLDARSMRTDETVADLVHKLGKLPLAFDPGTRWLYALNTDVVGYLCEVLSGQPLDRFLSERLFEPLRMRDTGFWVPPGQVHRLSACYRPSGPGASDYVLQDAPATSPFAKPRTFLSGVGGLLSTAHDYLQFVKMLASGGELDGARILSPRTLRLMATNHLPNGADVASMAAGTVGTGLFGYGFGLGFAVLMDPTRSQTLGTPGEFYWDGAASTMFFVSPKDDLLAIFLTQVMGANQIQRFGRTLRACVYGALLD
ncbi:MAG: serine hydrolase domain-containing protein [Chloroflexota bacterium]